METTTSLGQFLKRLREAKGLSLRQAAAMVGLSSGYLSQVEGGKRGRRKSGEYFAPHPVLLKKLAEAYHVQPNQLLERAGYLESENGADYLGISEEREVDRCFRFVIHDPFLADALTAYEKKAIVQRYETLTGRKLITWAGGESAFAKKSSLSGLRVEEGLLSAETVQQTLTEEEVAHELRISPEDLKSLVKQGCFKPNRNNKELVFQKHAIVGFKHYCYMTGMHLLKIREKEQMPQAPEEWHRAARELDGKALTSGREFLRQSLRHRTKKRRLNVV